MSISMQKYLLQALTRDDLKSFTAALNKYSLPIDSRYVDYDLLIKAIELKRKPFVDYLLKNGCRVVVKPGIQTPLHLAVKNEGWYDIIDRLITLKCPIDEKCTESHGDTAVHWAYNNGNSGDLVDLLLWTYLMTYKNCENVANDDGFSFLHIACSRHSVEVVKKLLIIDPSGINQADKGTLSTPLHIAVGYKRYAVAKCLLKSKANVYKQNFDKSTPLHLALKQQDIRMINLILDHDITKENIIDEYGLSHFMAACASSKRDVVAEYLKLAAKKDRSEFINAKVQKHDEYKYYTPLHFAVNFNQVEIVKLLLENKADCCESAANGQTPHILARNKGHDLICTLLNEHCQVFKNCKVTVGMYLNFENTSKTNAENVAPATPNVNVEPAVPPAKVAIPRNPKKFFSEKENESQVLPSFYFPLVILNEGITISNNVNPTRNPPVEAVAPIIENVEKQLLKAIKENDFDKFSSILEQSGCPKDCESFLLTLAIKHERKRMVLALLEKSNQVCKNTKSLAKTPLHFVATKVGWTDVVERLLEKGFRADDDSSKGDTPLHLAFSAGNVEKTVDVLLKNYVNNGLEKIRKTHFGFFHIACTRSSLEIVKRFVEANSTHFKMDSKYSPTNATPLHFAVEHKRHEIAEYLIRCGASIYITNVNRSTPLHLALELKDIRMIDLILSFDNVKRDMVDRFCETHFMAACAGTSAKIVQDYLNVNEEKYKFSPCTLIQAQVKNYGNNQISGYTSLHFASHFGRMETVELLLGYGADCCLVTNNGMTCHTLARDENVCRILKEHCDIVRNCKQGRASSPDFGKWGEVYERELLIERTRTIKSLRGSLNCFRSMSLGNDVVLD